MTKADLVEEVSRVTELTRKDSEVIVDTLFESVIKALKNGDKLEVRGFGSFRVRQRNARVGRNPNQPGTSFVIPPRATVKFKAGKIMRQRVEKLSRELKEASERRQNAAPGNHNGQ